MESVIQKTVRCSAKNKTGTQCKRMTSNSSGMCFQHVDQTVLIKPAKVAKDKVVKDLKPEPEQDQNGKQEEVLQDCCVCLETNVKEEDLLECKHSVCRDCVKQLRDPRCPMCRRDIKGKWITGSSKKRMARLQTQDRAQREQQALQTYLQQTQQPPTQHVVTTPVTQSVFQLIGSQPVSSSTRARSRTPVMFRLPDSEGGLTLTFYFPA
jgi:hypothetical protein